MHKGKRLLSALCIFAILAVAVFVSPRPALAAVAVYQQCSGQGSATTVTATCGSTTVSGNVLVALVRCLANKAITLPANWTSLATNHATTYGGYLLAVADVATVGAGTTYTFTVDTVATPNAIQLYELSGADTNLVFYVNPAAKTITTSSGSWTAIGAATGSMVPTGYQALSFASGITATNGGTLTPTFDGTFTTDTLVSGSNDCWIQPWHSTSPITTNTATGLTALTLGTNNAGMAINVLYGQAQSGLSIGRGISATGANSASPAFTLVGGLPIVGDLLVAEVFWAAVSGSTFSTPAGWNSIDNAGAQSTNNNPSVATVYRVVQSGDTQTFTFTSALSSSSNVWAIYGRELSGQNATTPNGHSYVLTASGSAATLPSQTPTVTGGIVVSGIMLNNVVPSLPAGFTSSASGAVSIDDFNFGYKTGLTTSPVAPAWGTGAGTLVAAEQVIIAPVATPPPSSCTTYINLTGVGC